MEKFHIIIVVLCLVSLSHQTNNETNSTYSRNFQGVDSGRYINPDEQCKIQLGKDASFCRNYKDQMCKNLFCRKSLKEPCIQMENGVKEGTTCESGKLCSQRECSENVQAPVGECLFGDDLVTQEAIGMKLPLPQMECKDVLKHITQNNQAATAYCSNSNFRSICCETCKKYDFLSCTDRYFDCPKYSNVCDSATVNGLPVTILCPRSCGKCNAVPALCPESENICKNGGKCVNIKVSNDSLFGFKCECAVGYEGDMCERRNSCVPNPCNVNDKCVSLGNIAYKCIQSNVTEKTTLVTSSTSYKTKTEVKSSETTLPTVTQTKTRTKILSVSFPTNELCENFNDDVCSYYAQQNLCGDEYYLNGKPITKKCRKACKLC